MQTPNIYSHPDDTIHLLDYVNVLIRRRVTFFGVAFLVFVAAALYTFLMKPVYEAVATLHVKEEKGKLSLLEDLALSRPNTIDAEIQILKSRTNAEKVVKRLHLNLQTSLEKGEPTFRLLELTPSPDASAYVIRLTESSAYSVADEYGNVIGKGKSGELVQEKDITLLLDGLQGAAGDRFLIELVPFNHAVKDLRKKTTAAEIARRTNIIQISYTDTDPVRAKDVVNMLIQAYLEQTIAYKTEEASRTVEFLEQQLESVKVDLDIAERNLQEFKSTTGIVQLDVEAEELIKKISSTEKERAVITLQKKQAEFALKSVKGAIENGTTYSPSVIRDDAVIAGMASKVAELEAQKQSLLSDYTAAHPAVKSLQEQIDELQNRIASTYETGMNNFEKQEGGIAGQISLYESQLKKLPHAERELARLTRLYKVNADIYTFLLQKREEARIAKASTISNIDIVDPAITPEEPVRPKKALYLFFGLLGGGIIGSFVVFSREYLDDTIKDAETAKRELGVPLLAIIPYFSPRQEESPVGKKPASLVAHYDPKSSVSEAFRSLRTSIHFSSVSKKPQVLLVTSSLPYEGKTTIIGNLAFILNQTGTRVLLIDCDLRRPSLHKLYSSAKTPGLTEFLAGDTDLDSLIHSTGIPGLDFIAAGTTPPNPAELLGSDKMKTLLETLRGRYDAVLIDAPPLLPVTDALLLSVNADLVFMVIEIGRVPIKAMQQAGDLLRSVGAPFAGFVLNDKSEERLERYGYYRKPYYTYGYGYYSYHHGAYGEESRDHQQTKKKSAWWQRIIRR